MKRPPSGRRQVHSVKAVSQALSRFRLIALLRAGHLEKQAQTAVQRAGLWIMKSSSWDERHPLTRAELEPILREGGIVPGRLSRAYVSNAVADFAEDIVHLGVDAACHKIGKPVCPFNALHLFGEERRPFAIIRYGFQARLFAKRQPRDCDGRVL